MDLQRRFLSSRRNVRPLRRLVGLAKRLNLWHAVVFCVAAFLLGQIINHYSPLRNFTIYQMLFTAAIVISFSELKHFVLGIERYRRMTASHPVRETGVYITKLLESNWSIPGIVVVGALYIYATISLEYIQLNLAGYFALSAISIVMFSAVLGQTCYVYYILLLRRIYLNADFKYNFYFPARTNWVREIARIGNRLNNAFFVLGFIYTTVFFLNMPDGYLTVSIRPWKLVIDTPNNAVFIASWITIFVIIILAFPAYAAAKSKLISLIVERMKQKSVDEIELLMRRGNIRDKNDANMELQFYQLIANIDNSPETPFPGYNLLPIAATISSVAVHLIKIFESLS